jgi:hypothetical protein
MHHSIEDCLILFKLKACFQKHHTGIAPTPYNNSKGTTTTNLQQKSGVGGGKLADQKFADPNVADRNQKFG